MRNLYKPVRWIFSGDYAECQKRIGEAKRVMFQLKNIQNTGSQQYMLNKKYSDGSSISVRTDVPGMDVVNVYVPFAPVVAGGKKYIVPLLWPAYEVWDYEYQEHDEKYGYGVILAKWDSLEPYKYVPYYDKDWNRNYIDMPQVEYVPHYIQSKGETPSEFSESTYGEGHCGGYGVGEEIFHRSSHWWWEDNGVNVLEVYGTIDEDKKRWVSHTPLPYPCTAFWLWKGSATDYWCNRQFGMTWINYESVSGYQFNYYNYVTGLGYDENMNEEILCTQCYPGGCDYYTTVYHYDAMNSAQTDMYLNIGKGFESIGTAMYDAHYLHDLSSDWVCYGSISGLEPYPYLCGIFYKEDVAEEEMSKDKKDEVMLYIIDYWKYDGWETPICNFNSKDIPDVITYGMVNNDKYVIKDYERDREQGGNHWFKENDKGKIEGSPQEARWYDYEWMYLVRLEKKYAKKLYGIEDVPDSDITFIDVGTFSEIETT